MVAGIVAGVANIVAGVARLYAGVAGIVAGVAMTWPWLVPPCFPSVAIMIAVAAVVAVA